MNETVHFLERHGYWLLVGAVLGRQACLPIPANLFLIAAGALARSGRLSLSAIVAVSVLTFVLADVAWYEAGRRLGDRILHFLCGLTRDAGACVHSATDAFARHGVRTLLFSKFVVGSMPSRLP
jgi:membrane protein DedA with SNARE-associated domain